MKQITGGVTAAKGYKAAATAAGIKYQDRTAVDARFRGRIEIQNMIIFLLPLYSWQVYWSI